MQKTISASRPRAIFEPVESRVMMSTAVGSPSPAWTDTQEGLTGTYYRGDGFKNEVLTRTDSNIDFPWGAKGPIQSLNDRAFSARWTGQITAQYSERYVFSTISDDGVRVWIGGKLVINDWHEQWPTLVSGAIILQAGQTYDIRVDYFENSHPPADLRLFWRSPSQTKELVPASAFTTIATQAPPVISAAPTQPDAPANIAVTAASQTQINLTWSDVDGEDGFVVQRSADGSTSWITIGSTSAGQTQYSDTGLTAGTTYFYRVEAMNTVGNSTPSTGASATTIAAPPPPAPDVVYGLTSDGYVDQIDVTTGTSTQIGTLLFGTSAGDRDPITGNFYYLDQNTSSPRVAVWDPTTNTNTVIATISLSGPVLRAAFRADGTFFITAGNGDLYTINLVTGAPTFVGTITTNGAPLTTSTGDMAFTPDGQLYLDTEGLLYSVDATTLNATYLGNDGSAGKIQIAFGTDGLLYGMAESGDLYLVDLTSGATTLIGDTGISQIGDLGSASV